MRETDLPQGIEESHSRGRSWHHFANPASVVGVGLLLVAALAGAFGGQPHPVHIIETPSATLRYELPEILRNGEFFEMRIVVEAKQPIVDAQIGVSSGYWRNLTINTMIPSPDKEKSEEGRYKFHYGVLQRGDRLEVKIDGQINPPMFLGNKGEITLMDGDRMIAVAPVELRVFP